MTEQVETIVIGAGVVGLAVARALALTGREVLVLDREDAFGTITSARNSEVIHAGIYYAKNSLKARMCVAGKHKLYDYCRTNGIAFNNCGKLIVACSDDEVAAFEGIAKRARDNGVEDLQTMSAADARAMEPELSCKGAIWSPSTGIVDSHNVMLTLLGEAEAHGAMLVLNTVVEKIAVTDGGFLVTTGGEEPLVLQAREVVNSAGLDAPGLAVAMTGLPTEAVPKQWIAKGNYFSLTGRTPFSRLIYPAPVTGGLGVHITIDLQGRARFGPDVEWLEDADWTDQATYAVDPARCDSFYDAIRRYWPALPDNSLTPDYSGIRPKLTNAQDKYAADFRISGAVEHGLPGYIGLYGIESPGLTSSLAIADHTTEMLDRDMRRNAPSAAAE
ncbi:MAG: NAD(P)/FAD-dependent oxidoreductase [Paracoccaceae bacterium]